MVETYGLGCIVVGLSNRYTWLAQHSQLFLLGTISRLVVIDNDYISKPKALAGQEPEN